MRSGHGLGQVCTYVPLSPLLCHPSIALGSSGSVVRPSVPMEEERWIKEEASLLPPLFLEVEFEQRHLSEWDSCGGRQRPPAPALPAPLLFSFSFIPPRTLNGQTDTSTDERLTHFCLSLSGRPDPADRSLVP